MVQLIGVNKNKLYMHYGISLILRLLDKAAVGIISYKKNKQIQAKEIRDDGWWIIPLSKKFLFIFLLLVACKEIGGKKEMKIILPIIFLTFARGKVSKNDKFTRFTVFLRYNKLSERLWKLFKIQLFTHFNCLVTHEE